MFVKEENHCSLLARKNGKERVEKEGSGGLRNGKAGERERCLILRIFLFFLLIGKLVKNGREMKKTLIRG